VSAATRERARQCEGTERGRANPLQQRRTLRQFVNLAVIIALRRLGVEHRLLLTPTHPATRAPHVGQVSQRSTVRLSHLHRPSRHGTGAIRCARALHARHSTLPHPEAFLWGPLPEP
jgi:hypothetical protein